MRALFVVIAFLGLAAHAQAPSRLKAEVVATGLQAPTALVFLPDGRGLLAERRGARLSLMDPRTHALTPLGGGLEASVLTGQDAGIHDVVLHPEFAANGWIYVSYSAGTVERSTTVVDRFKLGGASIVGRERIFTAQAWTDDRYHYGGRMAFLGGHLFVTVGDRHREDRVQDKANHHGKIVRMRDDGSAAETWSGGHRNPQGLAVDPRTGELWSHEHGPVGGDELNLVKQGANYGWPVVSWGHEYGGGPIGMGLTQRDGMEQPHWVWTPAIAPSGLVIYRGDLFPAWKGSFLVGAMGGRHLNRLVFDEGRVVMEERILDRKAHRVRLVAEAPDGAVYLGSDDGRLTRLTPL